MKDQTNNRIKPVLFVVTSNAVKGETGIPTGFWLSEVTHPLAKVEEANLKVEIASIKGGEAPIEPGYDLDDPVTAHYWNDADFRSAIRNTLRLDDVDPSRYSAIFFAGGHGPMWDFPESAAVRRVTRQMYEAGGVVGAVCHGPSALVNVVLSDGSYLVAGKQVASFTNEEEEAINGTQIVPFLLASALVAHGAIQQPAAPWTTNVVTDGRLVTGQNPQSASGVGEALADLLLAQTENKANPSLAALTPEEIRMVSPTLEKYSQETLVNGVWKRPGLSTRDRCIVTVSALTARNQTIAMPYYFNKALESGLTPGEISELLTHLAFYAGWPNAFSTVAVVKDLFVQRGIGVDQLPQVSPELLPIEQAVPDEATRAAFVAQNVGPVSPPLAQYSGDLLYHEVWLRPGLAPRDRSLASVSALIASGAAQFLPLYLSRAMDQGVTQEQVSEMLAHLAFYTGWAPVISASLVVKGVFDSRSN